MKTINIILTVILIVAYFLVLRKQIILTSESPNTTYCAVVWGHRNKIISDPDVYVDIYKNDKKIDTIYLFSPSDYLPAKNSFDITWKGSELEIKHHDLGVERNPSYFKEIDILPDQKRINLYYR